MGTSVASAGDVNGDGFGDLIVGMPSRSNIQIFLGSATGLAPKWSWSLNHFSGNDFGASVASAGDVNGDGYGDVIVGAPLYSNGEMREGAFEIWGGSATGVNVATLIGKAESNLGDARLGTQVASAGDVNGDGLGDVIVGSPNFHAGGAMFAGRAQIYFGKKTKGLTAASWTIAGTSAGGQLGQSVASAGDVDGDGYSDVIVGSPASTTTSGGSARVYLGNRGNLGDQSGLNLAVRALRSLNSPLAPRGSTSGSSFLVSAGLDSHFGRGLARVELEVKPLAQAFDGTNLRSGGWTAVTAAARQLVGATGLLSGGYHYRVRLRYHPSHALGQSRTAWVYGGIRGDARGLHLRVP
jgi:hypothetical protein